MLVSCECCVVRQRSLRRAEHSSRGVLPSVAECDREASTVRRPWPPGGCHAMGEVGNCISCELRCRNSAANNYMYRK